MREIKFRAWNTVKKIMYSAEELGADQEALLPDGRGFANISGDDTRLTQIHSHLLPLQYTGLLDKNGKEIYEGDIVLCPEWEDYEKGTMMQVAREVKWDNSDACFAAFLKDEKERYGYLLDNNTNIEVVGNIYENPGMVEENATLGTQKGKMGEAG